MVEVEEDEMKRRSGLSDPMGRVERRGVSIA